MSIEFLSELESKVEALISKLSLVTQENSNLKQELDEVKVKIEQVEAENRNLLNELNAVKADSQGREEKLSLAAEKIQGLLSKLESV